MTTPEMLKISSLFEPGMLAIIDQRIAIANETTDGLIDDFLEMKEEVDNLIAVATPIVASLIREDIFWAAMLLAVAIDRLAEQKVKNQSRDDHSNAQG